MKITVALCTYNPKIPLLHRALDAIEPQLQEVDSEFLLVDNNSATPLDTIESLKRYPLRIVRETRQGLTAAREAAIREAVGDVILFVDDDNILAPGYLKGVLRNFEDPKLGLLGGAIFPEYEVEPPNWFWPFEDMLAIRRHSKTTSVDTTNPPFTDWFPVGAGFAIRGTLASNYLTGGEGGTRIEGRQGASLSSGEDIDLCLFAIHRKYKLRVDGTLTLTHVISADRLDENYLVRLANGSIGSSVLIEKKWQGLFQSAIYPVFFNRSIKFFLKAKIYKALQPFSPKYKVKNAIYKAIENGSKELRKIN